MKKYITEQLLIEIVLSLFFLICTLFHLIENKYFVAVVVSIIAIILSIKYKMKRTIRPNYKNVLYVLIIFAILYLAFFYMFGLYSGFVKSSNLFYQEQSFRELFIWSKVKPRIVIHQPPPPIAHELLECFV